MWQHVIFILFPSSIAHWLKHIGISFHPLRSASRRGSCWLSGRLFYSRLRASATFSAALFSACSSCWIPCDWLAMSEEKAREKLQRTGAKYAESSRNEGRRNEGFGLLPLYSTVSWPDVTAAGCSRDSVTSAWLLNFFSKWKKKPSTVDHCLHVYTCLYTCLHVYIHREVLSSSTQSSNILKGTQFW